VQFILQYFWGHIAGGATLLGQGEAPHLGCEPEVHYLQVGIVGAAGHQQVFWLEVTVHDGAIVHVLDGAQKHLHQVSRLLLAVLGLAHDAVEELAPVDLLQYEVEVARLLEEVETANDVGVVQRLQQADLPSNALLRLSVDGSRDDLDRHSTIIHATLRPSHLGESALAQQLADHVTGGHAVWEV